MPLTERVDCPKNLPNPVWQQKVALKIIELKALIVPNAGNERFAESRRGQIKESDWQASGSSC